MVMEYIVTGGAGYIGGHLSDRLIERGKVTVIDDFSAGSYINKKARLVKADLRNSKCLDGIEFEKGSEIYHFAANPDVKTSMMNVSDHFGKDVATTLTVLELAKRIEASKVVFASSSVVYGDAEILPTPETYPTKPISNYGLFKLICESMLEFYSRTYGIETTVLRFANIVGGRTATESFPTS